MIVKLKLFLIVIIGFYFKYIRYLRKLFVGGDEFVCKYSFKIFINF